MQISYRLLVYLADLGDAQALVARNEYMAVENRWAERHKHFPAAIEVFFTIPDQYLIHTPTKAARAFTTPGTPVVKGQSRTNTVPGIPAECRLPSVIIDGDDTED